MYNDSTTAFPSRSTLYETFLTVPRTRESLLNSDDREKNGRTRTRYHPPRLPSIIDSPVFIGERYCDSRSIARAERRLAPAVSNQLQVHCRTVKCKARREREKEKAEQSAESANGTSRYIKILFKMSQ